LAAAVDQLALPATVRDFGAQHVGLFQTGTNGVVHFAATVAPDPITVLFLEVFKRLGVFFFNSVQVLPVAFVAKILSRDCFRDPPSKV
jgi:hypothetical protein